MRYTMLISTPKIQTALEGVGVWVVGWSGGGVVFQRWSLGVAFRVLFRSKFCTEVT